MFGRRRTSRSPISGASRSALQRREIVTGASSGTTLERLEFRRLLAASDLDVSFGTGGIVLDGLGDPGVGAVAIDGNGIIWALGNTGSATLARYSSSGTPLGTVPLPAGFIDVIDIAAAPGNKVVVVGTDANPDFIVARYNSNGSIDTSFDNDGVYEHVMVGTTEMATGVVVRDVDESILVVGTSDDGDKDFAALQLDSTGTPDNSFGTNGFVTVDLLSSADEVHGVALQSNGTAVLAGQSLVSGSQAFALVRLDTSGNVVGSPVVTNNTAAAERLNSVAVGSGDAIFAAGFDGTQGALVRYSAAGAFIGTTAVPGVELDAFGVAVDNDGNVLVTGLNATADVISLTRFDSSGSLDAGFGTGGNVQTNTGAILGAYGLDIAVQSDDKIVVFGSSDSNFALVRYGAGGGNFVVANLVGSTLIITGTTDPDDVRVVLTGSLLDVLDNNVSIGTFAAGGTTITFNGDDGDDRFEIATSVTNPSEAYGGEGNDTMIGGGGKDALFGEGGNDWLRARGNADILVAGSGADIAAGGASRDVMIGGTGADQMAGDADSDILISGSTDFDNDLASLKLIQAEWLSGNQFFVRVNNLENGTGLNGPNVRLTIDTVHDDSASDTLSGGSGSDWFLIELNGSALDLITDLSGIELAGVLDFILTT